LPAQLYVGQSTGPARGTQAISGTTNR
jgi:hypothetical protein